MDDEKKAEVVELFRAMAKGAETRPKPARKAGSPAKRIGPGAATIIVGSTILVLQEPMRAEVVSRLLNLLRSS